MHSSGGDIVEPRVLLTGSLTNELVSSSIQLAEAEGKVLKSVDNIVGHSSLVKADNSEASNLEPLPVVKAQDRDIIRMIVDYLKELGFTQTADSLLRNSGCALENSCVTELFTSVMDGDWDVADQMLRNLMPLMSGSDDVLKKMRFLMLEQKYLELLDDDRSADAVYCLRQELTPLKFNTKRVEELCWSVSDVA